MALRCLVALLITLALAPAAQAQVGAPQNLHAFLLRASEPEDPTRTYPRTPSFAWGTVRGAVAYEFQVSTSRTFSENGIIWESETLKTPVTAIPLTLPWMTGAPNSLYARVRALLPGDRAGAWSARYGFRMRAPGAPASLSTGATNPIPGMIRWTPVEGATAYEVSFLFDLADGKVKKVKTATTAADLREFYTFHNDLASLGINDVHWRVRAVRELEGNPMNNLPVVSYGPWSSEFVTYEPPLASTPITLGAAISRSRSNDNVSTLFNVGPAPHELIPGFAWNGRFGANGNGACPADVAGIVTCPLYHVYVYSDEDCVNRVHSSDVVGSPAYVPRLTPPLKLPASPIGLSLAATMYLGDADKDEGKVYDAGGYKVWAAGTAPGLPIDPELEDLAEGEIPDRRSGLWDNDWPDSRYYWTVVPAVPYLNAEGQIEYRDVEFSEAMCLSGQVGMFGKTSAPAIERANGVPYASGLTAGGDVRGATSDRPTFFGRAVVAWQPAPGATKYEVQWSRRASPFRAIGTTRTPATAAVLNLPDGVWHYRVRGIDTTLPTLRQGMTWSDAQYLKMAPRVFVRVR